MDNAELLSICEDKVRILKQELAYAESEVQRIKMDIEAEQSRREKLEQRRKDNPFLQDKATRRLAEYFLEKGFLITALQSKDTLFKNLYGLAKNILAAPKDLIPFCKFIYARKADDYSLEGLSVEGKTAVCNFCTTLKNMKWLAWRKEKDVLHIERKIPKDHYVFFNGVWAEEAIRYLIEKTLVDLKVRRRAVYRNVKIERLDVEQGKDVHQFDFIVEFRDRFYLFEVKTGTTLGVERWIDHARLFHDEDGLNRFLMCCNDDAVDARIFRPYRLFHLSSLEKEFGEYLKQQPPLP